MSRIDPKLAAIVGAVLALSPMAWAEAPSPPPSPAATESKQSIDQMGWLAGCWTGTRPGREVLEYWMPPSGGSMLGMGRTVKDERTVDFEFMRIHEEGGKLRFTSKPSGQAEDSFDARDLSKQSVIFENPTHDFPQRIIYRMQPDGSLLARIEGKEKGQERGVDFPMKRTKCPDGADR